MITKKFLYIGMLGMSLPLASAANAQNNDNEIEEVVVKSQAGSNGLSLKDQNTASNRLGLEIIDVPASLELISKEEIAIKADHSSLSAVTRATGFASSASPGNGGSSVAVRGFNGHGSVVQTYDGTRLYVGAGTVTFPADTWTLEKVEVLRGPGSVINGVGAIGATVNYIPKAPTFDDISNEVDVTLGSFGLRRVALGSGGKINNVVAYRIDVVNHETDGYVDRADETRNAIAGSFLLKPADNLDIKLSVDYADIDDATYWGTPLVNDKIVNSTRRNNYNVKDGIIEYKDLWPRLQIKWEINDSTTFNNNTYYLKAERQWRNVESYDFNSGTGQVDRSFYLEILHDQEQIGTRNDVLFSFDIGEMENLLNIGFEVNSIDFTHTNNSPYGGSTSVSLLNPNPGTWAQGVIDKTTKDYTTDTLQYAFFIDEHLQINEQFAIIAGLRHDRIDYEREDFARSNGQVADKITNDLSGTSWRLGTVFQPIKSLSLYLQASEAVDSIQSILTATNPDLELAEGRQIEAGLKQQLWNDRLQYTVSIFDIEKKNLLSQNPGGVKEQIGQQSSQGIELELFMRPSDTFDIDFNIAMVDPKFDEFVSGGESLEGNTPRNVPKTTANLWMNWQFIDNWMLSGGARYVGKRYADNNNEKKLPEYTVFDASVQWIVIEGLQLSLRGKNLSDEKNYVLAPYGNQWILGDGRSAEIGVNYTF